MPANTAAVATNEVSAQLISLGISVAHPQILVDSSTSTLVEAAIERHEGKLSSTGALCIQTGAYTGRSPEDRFIVDTPDVHDDIAWGKVNKPMPIETYEKIKTVVTEYLSDRNVLYVQRCLAGAMRIYSRKFLVVCENASQALFARQLLVRPAEERKSAYGFADFVVLAAPNLKLDPELLEIHSEACVLINFQERVIIVAGTGYCGEIKKAVFSTMNYLMPVQDGVLPMHSSCNVDPRDHTTAVFFGLSGTGKTTLSADPRRSLVGDDEHGWSDEGVFNFEGGCYAKAIRISPETEPEIYNAIRFGAVCENVVLDNVNRIADYYDDSLTENTRVAYPIEHIDNSQVAGFGGVPNVVIFLTADAFGVLPPISRLTTEGAMYQFVSGFTSKVAGTERGVTEPEPTFSTLFGEPFMPLDPLRYADMFGKRMTEVGTRVYLINTGWTGGPYGVGDRISLTYTRLMVTAALSGTLEKQRGLRPTYRHDPIFNVDVPLSVPGVPDKLLDPRSTWADPAAYDRQAKKLAQMFVNNQRGRFPNMAEEVIAAGPQVPEE
jgi:phosphoenolpyruvate carboxykinase (ATP)